MQKINQLDKDGFYVCDYIIDADDGRSAPPEFWTEDLVGDGFIKAQYQEGVCSDTGAFTGGHWVETGIAPAVDYLTPATSTRDEKMAAATIAIAPLQDAVDLDEATDDETALLKKWKQYRVALNRLDLSTAPDITWPVLPTVQTGS